jgi:hypothetical protein
LDGEKNPTKSLSMPHYEHMTARARRFVRAAVLGRGAFATAVIGALALCSACSSEDAGDDDIGAGTGTGGLMNIAPSASGGHGAASGGADANTGSGGHASSPSTNGSSVDSGTSGGGGGAIGSDLDSGSPHAGDVDAGHVIDAGQRTACKRGIATNTAPGAAFFPAIAWWYNWSMPGSGPDTGIEFVPMTWGKADVDKPVPAGAKFLLTFNEPNFHAQSNLTAQEAANAWPMIEAKAAHVPIVGPGMNFCGPAENCNGTSPYQYLKDFFAACTDCQVDFVAVHWYNCDLPSLKDYLEPGGNLEGFEQFGKPIWLTEFSCNGDASVADQEAFMREAIPYLESNPHVFRYSWFSAGPIPNAKLMNDDGSPNALGEVYASLPQSCD